MLKDYEIKFEYPLKIGPHSSSLLDETGKTYW